MQYVVVKNQGLSKNKKQLEYLGKYLYVSNLGLKTPLIRFHYWLISCYKIIKMNERVNKLLLAGDKLFY